MADASNLASVPASTTHGTEVKLAKSESVQGINAQGVEAELPSAIANFIAMYQKLGKDNLSLLDEVYNEQIEFKDPLHHIKGLQQLKHYFAGMYENVLAIKFDIHQVDISSGQPQSLDVRHASVFWTMTYQHPKLAKGEPIEVEGMSQLKFADKVMFHRDYFDGAAMVYQHIPVLGWAINKIKQRVATDE
ncbi:nuclear transport factor 2 family protein [Shewanella maritima]